MYYYIPYFSLIMENGLFVEVFVFFYHTTRCHYPKGRNLNEYVWSANKPTPLSSLRLFRSVMHMQCFHYIYMIFIFVTGSLQGEHKFFPWLQTFITRKLPEHVRTLRCTSEEFQPWIIFQQDGALPHRVSDVRRFLEAIFPNRWIGRDGPTPWPPRSPDITPLDFFLWRYVKAKVFLTPVPDITNMKARITDAFVTITEDMLENTWREIDYRLDVLRATKGAHVGVY